MPGILLRYTLLTLTVIVILIYIVLSPSVKHGEPEECFRAAVYEYHPSIAVDPGNAWKFIEENLKAYSEAAGKASAHKSNVIVFPENGLISGSKNRSITYGFLELIPEPGQFNPCLETNGSQNRSILRKLSCLARTNKLYLSAILGEKVDCDHQFDPDCPDDGRYQYNSQVLFDNQGELIAKYRKSHLFSEPQYDQPKKPEIVSILTPLGKFGLLICFDLLFTEPLNSLLNTEKVDTLLFGSQWIDELPFLSSHQVQSAASLARKVNLLAAGLHDLRRTALGSGIYSAVNGPMAYSHDYGSQHSRLIIASLPKSRESLARCDLFSETIVLADKDEKKTRDDFKMSYKPWQTNLTLFNRVKLNKRCDQIQTCHGKVCCELKYCLKDNPIDTFYLIALRWIRPTTKICEEFCGLVAYDETISSFSFTTADRFDLIQLQGTFTDGNIYPSVLVNNLELMSPSKWMFIDNHGDNRYSIHLGYSNEHVIAATLYQRCVNDDQ